MTDQAERFLLAAANDFEGMTYSECKAAENAVVAYLAQIGGALVKCQKHMESMLVADRERLDEGAE